MASRFPSWSKGCRTAAKRDPGCGLPLGIPRRDAYTCPRPRRDRRPTRGRSEFNSAQQLEHLLQIAAAEACEPGLRTALQTRTIIASIGPTTSKTSRSHGLPVDIEPDHPKLAIGRRLAARWRDTAKATQSFALGMINIPTANVTDRANLGVQSLTMEPIR